MRRVVVVLLVIGLLLAFGAVAATADTPTNFVAHLSGAEEVPPVPTLAQGQTKFQLSADGSVLHYRLIAANITGVTQAHIHCGARGVNGPVVAFLFGFDASGVDVNGVLAQGALSAANVIPRPDSPACPGGVANFEDMIAKMKSGGAYVNVHTLANPPGEIRGQIRLAGN